MFIRIETSSGLPITRQIMDQIRTHCATGVLSSGERLPSVRGLAQELAVNQNTILRVYERLTAEGLLERRHGDGTYVADRLPKGRIKAQHEMLELEAQRFVQQARSLNISADDLHRLIDRLYDSMNAKNSKNERSE
jgi:GntR family transcriptional regulator